MKHFQIKLVDKSGCGSFLYFDATDETAKDEACKTTNEYLEQKRYRDETLKYLPFYNVYKPHRTIKVVEYDKVNHCTKRGGLKFKLYLSYLKLKFADKRESINEWYSAD